MGKRNKKKTKNVTNPKMASEELKASRNGGQNALAGYSYQLLYSCYLMLSSADENISFQLEGIEDIDCILHGEHADHITHIQLKHSDNQQDASFLRPVLKNFLEAYLLETDRYFKLVYDFPVAKGYLKKMFDLNLDNSSRIYWNGVILNIKQENPAWNWNIYDFDEFLSHLSFEKVEKSILAKEIEKSLIGVYGITTDNIALFVDSIKFFCFRKMVQRDYVNRKELDAHIQTVKIDISKGDQNPADSWIRKLDYSMQGSDESHDFYEGKTATPADIVRGLPVRRLTLEREIVNSIQKNTVTVIKASSGQGKTTLALRAAYILRNEYTIYQLIWCNEVQHLENIVQYFKARIRLGEKPLIIIDNLTSHSAKWNDLAQCLQSELSHYKLLITSREMNWHSYKGDLSHIRSLKVIQLILGKKEAKIIHANLKNKGQIHADYAENWEKAWNIIAEKKLLLEYVYLLTHGNMLEDRISSQISEICKSSSGKLKCEILRKISFADVCGIRISVANLLRILPEDSGEDFGELLKSMESEFFNHIDDMGGYIEGLHPIRSKYIVKRLHEFMPIEHTAISVIKIAEKPDLPVLFSHFPKYKLNKSEFTYNVVETLWDEKDLSNYIPVIKGLFVGSAMEYYRENESLFNDVISHRGLAIISNELFPYKVFPKIGMTRTFLDTKKEEEPENKNVKYLDEIKKNFSVYQMQETLLYAFCRGLYDKLCKFDFSEISDIESYASISEWIYNVDTVFNLSVKIPLDYIWQKSKEFSLDCLSTLMYVAYCGNENAYRTFVEKNLDSILTYLKHQTKSVDISIDSGQNKIYVQYILRVYQEKSGDEESVSRLKYICRTLPIFDLYCADGLKSKQGFLSLYFKYDDEHKEMSVSDLIRMFHEDFISLWWKTIMIHYEYDTVTEWLEYWFGVRERICLLADKSRAFIHIFLSRKIPWKLIQNINRLYAEHVKLTIREKSYPGAIRPFKKTAVEQVNLHTIRNTYFKNMELVWSKQNSILSNETIESKSVIESLMAAQSALVNMQQYFSDIIVDPELQKRHSTLSSKEKKSIETLLMCCEYFQAGIADKHFIRKSIKVWYAEKCQNERKGVEEKLAQLQSRFSIHFPKEVYMIGAERGYPIVVENSDKMSECDWDELLSGCASFADAPFNYLTIVFSNNRGEILPMGFLFSKQLFVDFKKTNDSNTSLLVEKLHPPYPIHINARILDCFHEKYDLPKVNADIGSIPYVDILEECCIYSTLSDSLTSTEDAEYLREELQNVQANIEGQLHLLEIHQPVEIINQLRNILSDTVFSGKELDDDSFERLMDTLPYDEFVDALHVDNVYKSVFHNLGKYMCEFPEEGDDQSRGNNSAIDNEIDRAEKD